MTSLDTPHDAEPRLAVRLLIVPDAHVRVDAIEFQLEMYELFHRTWPGRAGHMLGTPTVLVGIFVGATLVHPWLGGAVAGAVAIGMAIGAWRLDRLAAVLAALEALALALLAARLATHVGAPTTLALTLGGCAVQTLSHVFEDVPPPHARGNAFVPARQYLRSLTPRSALRSLALTVGVFYWLELWASLRILPLQILHLAMRAGYRPALRRRLDERLAVILSGADPRWREAPGVQRG